MPFVAFWGWNPKSYIFWVSNSHLEVWVLWRASKLPNTISMITSNQWYHISSHINMIFHCHCSSSSHTISLTPAAPWHTVTPRLCRRRQWCQLIGTRDVHSHLQEYLSRLLVRKIDKTCPIVQQLRASWRLNHTKWKKNTLLKRHTLGHTNSIDSLLWAFRSVTHMFVPSPGHINVTSQEQLHHNGLGSRLLMPPRHDMAIYKMVIVCYSCGTVLGWILYQLNSNCFGFGLKFTLMQSRHVHQSETSQRSINKRWISIAHQPFSLVTKKRVKKITAKCASPNLVCQVHHFTVCQCWIWVPSLH